MKLKELLNSVDDEDVLDALFLEYDEERKNTRGYRDALAELRGLEPAPGNANLITIYADRVTDSDFADEDYVHIYGKVPDDDMGYALEFTSWNEWLSMSADLCGFAPAEFMAHCLWEMTFCGYSNDEIKKKSAELDALEIEVKERYE